MARLSRFLYDSTHQSQLSRATLRLGETVTHQGDDSYPRLPHCASTFGPSLVGKFHPCRNPLPYQYSDAASDDSDEGLRTRQLESLAKDIERFDPSNPESSIDDYLREVEHCLLDLPNPSAREKLKLVWKTTPRSVHVFMETHPPATRDRFSSLCQALREEYFLYNDPVSATLGALSIIQKKLEPPREYYRRLRVAYFLGRNAPA